jgi:hypothetical protein
MLKIRKRWWRPRKMRGRRRSIWSYKQSRRSRNSSSNNNKQLEQPLQPLLEAEQRELSRPKKPVAKLEREVAMPPPNA